MHVISSLGKGGAERLVVDLCNQFSSDPNIEITLCVFYENAGSTDFKNELSSKVNYINFKKKGKISLAFQFRIFACLLKLKPHIVNTHLSGTVLYMYLPIVFLRKIFFFHTIHNLAVEETPNKIFQKLRKYIYNTGKLKPISISRLTQSSHKKLYGVDSELIYNGVQKQNCSTYFDDVRKEIAGYKKTDGTKIFLSIGRINSPKDQKNYKLLINVFSKLKQNNIDAALLIIGADNSKDKATLNFLLKNKADNTFLLGPKNNIPDYMLQSDFYCLSSIFEGLPITIIEALAYGLPVISTNVGGISELIQDKENGLLVNSFDPVFYYNKIFELLNFSTTKIDEIKKLNEEKYIQHFTIQKAAENYVKLYLRYTFRN